MKVSLQFIADKAKVSKSLVSKVLNGKEVRVSKETKNKIETIAKKYNYIPNRMAAGLRTNKTKIIGCVMPGLYSDFFSELVSSIEAKAQARGYQIILCNAREDVQLERKYLEFFRSGMMDGLIVNPSDNVANLDMFQNMKAQKYPFVFVDRYIDQIGASYVCSDGYLGGYVLTKELIQKGHKRILFMSHGKARNTSVQVERFAGYEQAMLDNGLRTERVYMSYDGPIAERETYKILSEDNKPTGIVLVSSWDINYLLQILRTLSLSIPNDIDLATFDNFSMSYSDKESMQLAECIHETPIIAQQNPRHMGEYAVEILCEMIEEGNNAQEKVYLTPLIKERE